jgi:hypothetical protein
MKEKLLQINKWTHHMVHVLMDCLYSQSSPSTLANSSDTNSVNNEVNNLFYDEDLMILEDIPINVPVNSPTNVPTNISMISPANIPVGKENISEVMDTQDTSEPPAKRVKVCNIFPGVSK